MSYKDYPQIRIPTPPARLVAFLERHRRLQRAWSFFMTCLIMADWALQDPEISLKACKAGQPLRRSSRAVVWLVASIAARVRVVQRDIRFVRLFVCGRYLAWAGKVATRARRRVAFYKKLRQIAAECYHEPLRRFLWQRTGIDGSIVAVATVLAVRLRAHWRRVFGAPTIKGPNGETWLRPPWLIRAAIWLRMAPWQIGIQLSNKNVDLWSGVFTLARHLAMFTAERFQAALSQSWPGPTPDRLFRAYQILYFEQENNWFQDVQPYDPVADAPAIRRAVASVAVALAALVGALLAFLVPAFLPFAGPAVQAIGDVARAYISGVLR